jgi:hypothetical protein
MAFDVDQTKKFYNLSPAERLERLMGGCRAFNGGRGSSQR